MSHFVVMLFKIRVFWLVPSMTSGGIQTFPSSIVKTNARDVLPVFQDESVHTGGTLTHHDEAKSNKNAHERFVDFNDVVCSSCLKTQLSLLVSFGIKMYLKRSVVSFCSVIHISSWSTFSLHSTLSLVSLEFNNCTFLFGDAYFHITFVSISLWFFPQTFLTQRNLFGIFV